MSHYYRIQLAPPADQARYAMTPARRAQFDIGIQRLATDPYGHGSARLTGDPDRRRAVGA
ncbi:hypothetical protein PUR49_10475 [Streptomyces sp. BE147]|uniref:hypothetical protein n=1 Tax=Streptomyces sp. BE147 TaxID=3002524 RepID=UPI002E7A4AA8|nr:hypothetical protein [Streptomyces sp. BE147]MEE1736924.1 hypothetical protein [Streptomyces sp. BE147]